MIKINGVEFAPRAGCNYKNEYVKIAEAVASGRYSEADLYRALILDDLFFIVNFVMRIPIANHPFVVQACRDVEDGPKDFTLDIWAREHFKSSIITIAETIQDALRNPDEATGIFSYVRPVAKKFLFSIKETFQTSRILKLCFPDVVYQDCEKEATLWSLDEGLILKRTSNRPEATISAWGLTEGMPTGLHFERRKYDDIVTEDIAESPDVMDKVKTKFDSSQNVGKEGGTHRVVGTYYHHFDPLKFIQGKKTFDGKPLYTLRFKPGSHDGTATGKPVFVSQARWDQLRQTRTFSCQQLLDPSPKSDARLNPDYMLPIERKFIPKDVYRFMLVDQAGDLDASVDRKGGDPWAIGIVSVVPYLDDIGLSDVFVESLWANPSNASEAIDQIVRMYLESPTIMRLGVEKVSISTTHNQISDALRARGRHVEFDRGGTGVFLRPAGRMKKKFIEDALMGPLNNGKIHYSTAIPAAYMDRLKMEMAYHPVWHDDILNLLAYLYDMIRDFRFGSLVDEEIEQSRKRYEPKLETRTWMGM